MNDIKLFLGDDFYPYGGWDDFIGYFNTKQEAIEWVERNHGDTNDKWAHIVMNDIVIGRGEIGRTLDRQPLKWEWINEGKTI